MSDDAPPAHAVPPSPWRDPSRRFQVQATAESHFSWLRTRMSTERTLMSWMRTATSLIGFGFTIVQFFIHLRTGDGPMQLRFPQASGYFGLALILAGTVALAVSIQQYRRMVRYLWSDAFAPVAGISTDAPTTPALPVAVVLVVIGTFAAVSVIVNLF